MSFVPTFYPGTPDGKGAQHVAVGIGEQINGIDFPLVPGRTVNVSGTAFDSHGQPLANVMLAQETLGPNGGTAGSGGNSAVAADGTFTIRNVAPGEYRLIAAGSGGRQIADCGRWCGHRQRGAHRLRWMVCHRDGGD
jgi:hypothetical protein